MRISDIDVQFGALDFGSEETFDSISEKFQATNIGNIKHLFECTLHLK